MNIFPKALRWGNGELYLLDQTRLPLEVVEERQENIQQVWICQAPFGPKLKSMF